MPDGAQGIVVLDAYPSREEAFIGSQFKTLENCKASLARAEEAQVAAAAAHKANVVERKAELKTAGDEFDLRCEGFSDAEITRVISEFEVRRAEAAEDAADIKKIRERRRKK